MLSEYKGSALCVLCRLYIFNLYKTLDFMLASYTSQSFHSQWFDSGTGPDVDTCINSWLMKAL